jgi:hypothetical protein
MVFCLCSFAFIPGFTPDLFALDLTLNIPIELVNMPKSVTGGSVSCSAFGADRVHNVMSTQQRLGDGSVRFDFKGSYVATAKIVIKSEAPNPPNGLGYRCILFLIDTSWPADKTTTVYRTAASVLGRYAIDTSKPVKYEVSGIR